MSEKEGVPYNLPTDQAKQMLGESGGQVRSNKEQEPEETPSSPFALLDKRFTDLPAWTKWIVKWTIVFVMLAAAFNYGSAHVRQMFCQWGLDTHCEQRPEHWDRPLFP